VLLMMEGRKEEEHVSAEQPHEEKPEEKKDKKKHGGKDDIAELEASLIKAQEEAAENYDRFLRVSADLENFKKRASKEKADLIRYGNEELIKELLPVIDNLERALEHTGSERAQEGIADGVAMTLQQFLGILQRFGVTPIAAAGEPFDPTKHEAVMEQPTGDHDPGHVVTELQKGYLLNDRLVRPAKVAVAKAQENAESEKE
jgi:molecular chaperone GrpE